MQKNLTRSILTAAIALTITPVAFAQTLLVRIVERQDTKTELKAEIPDLAETTASKSLDRRKEDGRRGK